MPSAEAHPTVMENYNVNMQCYDGAATMFATRAGVATLLLEEPRAVFTHC